MGVRWQDTSKPDNCTELYISKCGRYMEGKKRVVPGEVSSAVETEYEAVVTTNGEKSAEAIVPRGLQASRKGLNFRRC